MRLIRRIPRILKGLLRPSAGLPNTGEAKTRPGRRVLLKEVPLAGFEYHRGEGIWPFLVVGAPLRMEREPFNMHDPNAIAVWFHNEHIGYVPQRENTLLARLMDSGERLEARIVRLLEEENPWRRVRVRIELKE